MIIIQLIGALLNGYRLFDLNIPRDILVQQNQLKYQRTLEKLRQEIDETMVMKSQRGEMNIFWVDFSSHHRIPIVVYAFFNVIFP